MSALGVFLVLSCLSPGAVAVGSLPSSCELQTYAEPRALGALALVAVCPGAARPSAHDCNRDSRLVPVRALRSGQWVRGQFFDPGSGRGRWDVLQASALAFGRPGPEPVSPESREWRAYSEGLLAGLLSAAVIFGGWLLSRRSRRRAPTQ